MDEDWREWSSLPDDESSTAHRPRRTAWRRKRRDESEFSAEAGAYPTMTGYIPDANRRHEQLMDQDSKPYTSFSLSSTVGWIGLIFAIASWFLWPVILGPTAAALGVYAYSTGSRALGIWAMSIGLIAAIVYIVLIPLYFSVR
ncbi:hypothetical protein [Paenibacillus xylaniclasticus]|uniref:hypothetical protein n=1 Tax=Paenibacillus xylaniclasticus TaxID=588083 RepID=UPI000FDC5E43|nr:MULTISPECIES: hypothetical protein [Paenibacillus]GFN30361.1 hypothetical protein PCURB6_06210 [Paenibacillus curdlanolyticus]